MPDPHPVPGTPTPAETAEAYAERVTTDPTSRRDIAPAKAEAQAAEDDYLSYANMRDRIEAAKAAGIDPLYAVNPVYAGGFEAPTRLTDLDRRVIARGERYWSAGARLSRALNARPDATAEERLATGGGMVLGGTSGGSGGGGGGGGAPSVALPTRPSPKAAPSLSTTPSWEYVSGEPIKFDTPAGVEGTVLRNRDFARSRWKRAGELPDPMEVARVRDETMAAEFGNTKMQDTAKRIDAEMSDKGSWWDEATGWLGTFGGAMEVFDYPREALWLGATGVASQLPEDTGGQAASLLDTLALTVSPVVTPVINAWESGLDAVFSPVGRAIGSHWAHQGTPAEQKARGEALVSMVKQATAATDMSWLSDPAPMDPADRAKLVDEIGDRLVASASNGELLKASQAHPGFVSWTRTRSVLSAVVGEDWAEVFLPGGRTRNIMGRDLLDVSVSEADAKRLASDALARGDSMRVHFWGALATETGRELYGMALNVVLDPMWLMGPAEASKVVSIGDETVRVAAPVLKVARTLEKAVGSWDEAIRVCIKAVRGDAEAVQRITQAAADSRSAAQKLTDEAAELRRLGPQATARLAESEAAKAKAALKAAEDSYQGAEAASSAGQAPLATMREAVKGAEDLLVRVKSAPEKWHAARIRQLELAATRHKSASNAARAILAKDGKWMAGQTGVASFHWGERTYEVGTRAMPLVRQIGQGVESWVKPWTLNELNRKVLSVGRSAGSRYAQAKAALTPGELLAWSAMYYGTNNKLVQLPQAAWRMLTMALGTRFIEPASMATSKLLRLWNKDEGAMAQVIDAAVEAGRQMALPGVPKEVWANYQEALGRYFDSLGSKDAYIKAQLKRIKREAHQILHTRQDKAAQWIKAGKPPGQSVREQWADLTYTVQDVLNEAGTLIGSGAGELDARPELVALIHRFESLRDELSEGVEADEVTQTMIRVLRSMQGTEEQQAEAKRLLDELLGKAEVERTALAGDEKALEEAVKLRDVTAQRAAAVKAAEAELTPQGLARGILRAQREAGVVPQEAKADTVRRILESELIAARRASKSLDPDQLVEEGVPDAVDRLLKALGKAWGQGGEVMSADAVAERLLREAMEEAGDARDATTSAIQRGLRLLQKRWVEEEHAAVQSMVDIHGAEADRRLTKTLQAKRDKIREWIAKHTTEAEYAEVFHETMEDLRSYHATPDDAIREKLVARFGDDADRIIRNYTEVYGRLHEKFLDTMLTGGASIRFEAALKLYRGHRGLALVDARLSEAIAAKGHPDALLATMRTLLARLPGRLSKDEARALLARLDQLTRDSAGATTVGSKWWQAAQRAVTEFREGLVAKVAATEEDIAHLKDLIPERRKAIEILDVEIADARKAYAAATMTVKAAPGEIVNGRNVGANMLVSEGVRRAATEWEIKIWRRMKAVARGYSQEEEMTAAFAMLRDAPAVPARAGDLGQRFGALPADMKELVRAMRTTFDQYEEWYREVGFGFVKDPVQRLKMWGTPGYVPHIALEAEQVAKGTVGGSRAVGRAAPGNAAIDAHVNLSMPARHARQIEGTIAEINAAGLETSFTLALDRVLSRYTANNGAISAADFFKFMLHGGVVKKFSPIREGGLVTESVVSQALKEGYVPLFTRPSTSRDLDLLLTGTAEEWAKAGVTAEELEAAIKEIATAKAANAAPEGSPFATWLGSAPIAQEKANIEGVVLAARREAMLHGDNLWTIESALAKHGGNWRDLTAELNEVATRNKLPHLASEGVEAFFTDETWRLFIPGRVAESMVRIFEDTAPATSTFAHLGKQALDAVNSIYKTWFTVTQLAFSTRNALGNALANMIDIGVHGVFSPKTNYDASRLYAAYRLLEQHGSLEAAMQAKDVRTLTPGVMDLWRNGIDLGDGVIHSAPEALRILAEHEALSRAYTVVGDLGSYEEDLASQVLRWGKQPLAATFRAIKEHLPYAVLEGAAIASGGASAGLVIVPRKIGEGVARAVEGHARLVNFLANVRRGGSYAEAGIHVKQFLFDYEDLTNFQKTWVRTLIPFFTWTQKNILLHSKMIFENPWYYQKFGQLFTRVLPNVAAAVDRDAGIYSDWSGNLNDENENKYRSEYLRSKASFPIPAVMTEGHPYLWFTGMGSPIEAAIDTIGMLSDLADIPRIVNGDYNGVRTLSMFSWAINLPLQWLAGRDLYYGRDFNDMNTADRTMAWLATLETAAQWGKKTGIPGIAGIYSAMHTASVDIFNPTITMDPLTGRASATGDGRQLWLMNATPWSAAIRKVLAMSDVYAVSLMTNAQDLRQVYRVPDMIRVLSAYLSMNVVQDDPAAHRKRYGRELLKRQGEAYESAGWATGSEEIKPK